MPKRARSRPEVKPNKLVLFIESRTGIRHGVYKRDVAREIGLSEGAFSIRMRNGKFDYAEIIKIFNFLGATEKERLEIVNGKE